MMNQDKRHGRIFLLGIIGFILMLTLAGLILPGPFRLGELSDVSFVALSDGQVLTYNEASGNWTNGYVNSTAVNMTLSELSDVFIDSIQNNQVIQYNETSGMWENRDLPSSSDSYAVSNLTDVSIVGLANGQILQYNDTLLLWENVDPAACSISTLTDVSLNGLGDLQILQYNVTLGKWENRAIPAQALAGLTDVSINSLSNNQILQYNSTSGKWENMNLQTWAISTLTDVSIVGLSNGQLLKYNSTSGQWENINENSYAVSNLTDVTLLGLGDSQVLTYNATLGKWENRGLPQSFPYANLTGVPQTFPYANLTGVPDLTDGLVLWLPLDDSAGNASDFSGWLNHGVISGASWVDGKYGKSLSLDGTNDFVDCGNNPLLDFTFQNFSISVWIYPDTLDVQDVFCRGLHATDGYRLVQLADRMLFCTYQSGFYQQTATDYVIAAGNWYHVVVVRVGAVVAIYVNGVNQVPGSDVHVNPATSTRTVKLGVYDDGVSEPFNGIIDEVRVYNRSLSGAEILALYNLP